MYLISCPPCSTAFQTGEPGNSISLKAVVLSCMHRGSAKQYMALYRRRLERHALPMQQGQHSTVHPGVLVPFASCAVPAKGTVRDVSCTLVLAFP